MLELEGLRKRYGERVALDDVSFAVEPGRMHGFVGPNGAGKTTTMRIVLGLLAADAGTVSWAGRPIDAAARRATGYMPEERGLYPQMRVAEQVAYFARLHGLAAAEADAAATRWLDRLGLADRAHDSVEKLSLGNQQRAQLAVALAHDPHLLVLDEPFSGVDPVGVDVLAEVLGERAAAGVPVVFSSHQLELVERLCDAVSIISAGRVVASGTVEELRRARAGRRLRVEVDGAGGADWTAGLSGATVTDRVDGSVVLELQDDTDDQAVLRAAQAAGRVRRFAYEEPTLAELFRAAVAER